MAFIYVTGAAGTGKSSLVKVLNEKGYAAYDEDAPAVGSAHEKTTNNPVSIPPVQERDPEWFSRHEWKVLDDVMTNLLERSKTSDIILLGNSISYGQALKLFNKIIYLQIDEATLRKRIAERADNDYGKTDRELEDILQKFSMLNEQYAKSNVVIVNASLSLPNVAKQIITHL